MKWWFVWVMACSSSKQAPPEVGSDRVASGSAPIASGARSGSGSSAVVNRAAPTFELCHGPWCWVSARPQGNRLNDVIARGNETWAVGSWGTVMHHDGTRWSAESLGETKLEAIWVAENGDVWVIGEGGFIAMRSGKVWRRFPDAIEAETKLLRAVSGSAPDDVWIVGSNALALHWNGSALVRVKLGTYRGLSAVLPIAKDNVWIAEGRGVHRWNGTAWKYEDVPGLGLSGFIDLRAISPTDVWAIDDVGIAYHWDGATWTFATKGGMVKAHDAADDESIEFEYTPGSRFHGRFAGTGTDLWVTGTSWNVQFTGGHWRDRKHAPKYTVAGTRVAGQVVSVGTGGRITRGTIAESSPLPFDVQRMWSDGAGTLVIAGYGEYAGIHGKLATVKDGKVTTTTYDGPAGGLTGRTANDVMTSGADGEIRRWDGTAWTKMSTPTRDTIRSLSGPWAVGDKGTILRLAGTTWTAVESPVSTAISRVASVSPELAWAITGAAILKWDGTAWTESERFADEALRDLDVVDPDHAWIATSKRLLAWDGKAWATAAGWPETELPHRVDARTATDLWVATPTAVWHHDGKTWSSDKLGIYVLSIVADEDAVWIGGADGALLMRRR